MFLVFSVLIFNCQDAPPVRRRPCWTTATYSSPEGGSARVLVQKSGINANPVCSLLSDQ